MSIYCLFLSQIGVHYSTLLYSILLYSTLLYSGCFLLLSFYFFLPCSFTCLSFFFYSPLAFLFLYFFLPPLPSSPLFLLLFSSLLTPLYLAHLLQAVAFENKVAPETENIFGDPFFESLDIVCAALDNVEVRQSLLCYKHST